MTMQSIITFTLTQNRQNWRPGETYPYAASVKGTPLHIDRTHEDQTLDDICAGRLPVTNNLPTLVRVCGH